MYEYIERATEDATQRFAKNASGAALPRRGRQAGVAWRPKR
ncbi:MAG: hypothetical protein ABSD10_00040 [Candidatus Saccharimonadales bacterium]